MTSTEIQNLAAVGMVLIAMAVVAWLAATGSKESLGALISVVSAGTGYFMRGRVQPNA